MMTLKVEHISKSYKHNEALSPFSFETGPGQCVVLCGGNGAGKSTMIQILAGLSTPTTGNVMLDDINLGQAREHYVEHIGYMPDSFPAQPFISVQEMLAFYASYRPSASKDQVPAILERIGLMEKKDEIIKRLSKGMRQRLLFGQALLGSPRLLLMDEPTNGLDPYWINEFVRIVKEVQQTGTIVVLSTHMMDVAADLGDTIYFMKEGKVVQDFKRSEDNERTTLQLLDLHRNA
ncbi:ABC transporter ATP-binding protein [Aquibacillus koreensis]|uniref:ABC transporter ATP-binding protein n=1 Tax=Aquibacillus koreensis TaxID=279446 RepID=A0A9X3WL72_9BACI|nr:ABC transporter ATP-binding protein [Aquibacillus koreensis]MCT2536498.1 ABC transporter ATP-binding protein [Aquibacillus koreensis]MDC3419414.1 ABC transporter ATP-binding protein [Aquibacillus koreensis]